MQQILVNKVPFFFGIVFDEQKKTKKVGTFLPDWGILTLYNLFEMPTNKRIKLNRLLDPPHRKNVGKRQQGQNSMYIEERKRKGKFITQSSNELPNVLKVTFLILCWTPVLISIFVLFLKVRLKCVWKNHFSSLNVYVVTSADLLVFFEFSKKLISGRLWKKKLPKISVDGVCHRNFLDCFQNIRVDGVLIVIFEILFVFFVN